MSRLSASLSLAFSAGLLLSSSLLAQPFEKVFGPLDSKDEGHRRVAPVVHCPEGRGYIAIGTRNLGVGAVSQVYLVRVNNAGTTLWERYYDVGLDGEADEGFALAEVSDGTGFMTTGSSRRGVQTVAHAMRIDCDGDVVFSSFYYPSVTSKLTKVVGHDIREAAVGDGITTNPGDFIIGGYIDDQISPNANGFLFRIDPAGVILWDGIYDTGYHEYFFGITEAGLDAFGGSGDVVAVGEWTDGGRTQAAVVRVDGNTGRLPNALLHCMALYGDRGPENFQSVIELKYPGQDFQLVMAGMSGSTGLQEDVYMVETKPNPCLWTAQTTIGNENHTSFVEWANDLIEILVPVHGSLGVPLGSIGLTGYVEGQDTMGDAFLLFTDPIALMPLAARRYGGANVDFGTSLAQNGPAGPQTQGFIIAGTTQTDWDASGDPMDLYLIEPNVKASTGCEVEWAPDVVDRTWEPEVRNPHVESLFVREKTHTSPNDDDTAVKVCN